MRTTVALATPPLVLLSNASLFLDFDGTIVDIADAPDAVIVGERLRAIVRRLLVRLAGRVAIVSGRDAAEVRRMIDLPSLGIAGSHGLEIHLADGRTIAMERPAELDAVLAAMRAYAGEHPGLLVEDKPLGAALHYRQRPDAEAGCRQLARALADRYGLHLQTGKMVVELRGGRADKGTALRRLTAEPQMAATQPIFLGDDDTDEDAFVVAEELGGCGVLVGPARPTAARYGLADVSAALDWLEAASRR